MIREVVAKSLCTQCGFCAGLCPVGAIGMTWDEWGRSFPKVDEGKCTRCRLCLEVCTGRGFDYGAERVRSDYGTGYLMPLGAFRSVWTGHAADNDLRRASASGGFVTAALSFILERRRAAGAVVAAGPRHGLYRGEAVVAADSAEAAAASGSWYLPLPMDGAVARVGREAGPFVVVGLPCHIQAWRGAEKRLPALADKVSLHLGLFCDRLVDGRCHHLLMRLHGLDPSRARAIAFRGRGWPGFTRVIMSDGSEKLIPFDDPVRKAIWKSYAYTQRRCLFCHDALAEFADISVGDAWLPEFVGDACGRNMIIARTEAGEAFCRELAAEKKVILELVEARRVEEAQTLQIKMKKRELRARFGLAKRLGLPVPEVGGGLPKPTAWGYVLAAVSLAGCLISERPFFGAAAPHLPWRLLAGLATRRREK